MPRGGPRIGAGRKRAPLALQLAKGERRPSRINLNEPLFPRPDSLSPPRGLTGPGRREWLEQIDRLVESGVLTAADMAGFEDLCRAISELRRYEDAAKRAGVELAIRQGLASMTLKLRAQVSQLRQQFGLTPSSRTSIRTVQSLPPITADDRYFFAADRLKNRR